MKTTLKKQLQLDLTAKEWRELEYALDDALSYHNQTSAINAAGIGFTKFIENLTRLKNAFEKIRDKRGTEQAAQNSIKRIIKKIPEYALLEVSLFLPGVFYDSEGKFKAIALRVADGDYSELSDAIVAIEHTLKDMRRVGKGGARKDAKLYVMGIQKLAQHFGEILPQYKISADPESYFSCFVMYWLEYKMGVGKEPKRKRHIQNAINDLKNWKKLL